MDVVEIARIVLIVSLILLALPFPIAIIATAVAMVLAGFVAIESRLDFTGKSRSNRPALPRPGG
jgi:hypothetical protein